MTFPTDLERLLREATEGPWFSDGERLWRRHPSELYERGGTVAGDKPLAVVNKGWYGKNEAAYPAQSNAELIALLRNHAPAILELVRAAQQIAKQKATVEMDDEEKNDADYEAAYDAIVFLMRSNLAALDKAFPQS